MDQTQPESPARRVLLVEDEAISRMALEMILRRQGFAVTCAASGEEAVLLARAQRFDCVLMDINMPGMNGMEATRAIRSEPACAANAQAPIVALTAYASREDVARFFAAGMTHHLPKPVDMDDLAALLGKIFARTATA